MNLFDMNGPLMNALRKLANIFLCNVMFCLLSLPVITIGASLSALFVCMQAILTNDEDDVIVKQYWKAFLQNLAQATVIWAFCLLVFAFLGIYYLIVISMTGLMGRAECTGSVFLPCASCSCLGFSICSPYRPGTKTKWEIF